MILAIFLFCIYVNLSSNFNSILVLKNLQNRIPNQQKNVIASNIDSETDFLSILNDFGLQFWAQLGPNFGSKLDMNSFFFGL